MKVRLWGLGISGIALALVAGITGYGLRYGVSRTIYEDSDSVAIPVQMRMHLWGGSVSGVVANEDADHIITSVVIHVMVTEKRKCSEKSTNSFAAFLLTENCKKDPSYTADDIIDGQSFECFHGNLRPYAQASCEALAPMSFDPSRQQWSYFVKRVMGRPVDPLGILSPK
jgi:hypothetical protein